MDYSSIGLDDQLRSVNSLAGGTVKSVQSLEFDSNYEVPSNGLSYDKVRSITADQVTAGTINSLMYIGGSSIYIDGINNRIIVNDGTTDRILIGYGSGLF